MQRQLKQSSSSVDSSRRRKTKKETQAFWNLLRPRIYRIWYEDGKKSKETHQIIRNEESFCITYKQWRDQTYGRWGWKKNFNKRDWAIALYLLFTAHHQGIQRRVSIFLKEVTRDDLDEYMRKPGYGPSALLSSLRAGDTIPWYIAFKDGYSGSYDTWKLEISPLLLSDSPEIAAARQESSERRIIDVPGSPLTFSTDMMSTTPVDSHEDTHFDPSRMFSVLEDSNVSDENVFPVEPPVHRANYDRARIVENVTSGEHAMALHMMRLVLPYSSAQASSSKVDHLEPLHRALSRNGVLEGSPAPLALLGNLQTIQDMDPDDFNTLEFFDEQTGSEKQISLFLFYCLQAHILQGNGAAIDAHSRLMKASEYFKNIVTSDLDNSLSMLSNLICLFEPYGQMNTVRDVLQISLQALRGLTDETAYFGGLDPFGETIRFMLKMLDSHHNGHQYDLQMLENICTSFRKFGDSSRLFLVAQLNLSWALLQMGRKLEARKILIESKENFEKEFGKEHVQTIAWITTLARAHLECDYLPEAEEIMFVDLMDRTHKKFKSTDPFALEKRYLQGIYLLEISSAPIHEDEYEDKKTDYVRWAETILQDVLFEQAKVLRAENRRTQATLSALKTSLEDRGNPQEAKRQHQLFMNFCAQQSQDLNSI